MSTSTSANSGLLAALCMFASIILAVLKVAGILAVSWLIVALPILLYLGITLVVLVILIVVATIAYLIAGR